MKLLRMLSERDWGMGPSLSHSTSCAAAGAPSRGAAPRQLGGRGALGSL